MALLGCEQNNAPGFENLYVSVTGNLRLPVKRLYVATESVPNSKWTAIQTAVNAGYQVFASFKLPGTWAQVAAGAQDAGIDSRAAFLAGLSTAGRQNWLTWNHEPENDGQPAADFRTALTRVRDRFLAAGVPESQWIIGPLFMASTMIGYSHGQAPNHSSGRVPGDWIIPCNIIYVDYYNYMGASTGPWAQTASGSPGSTTYINTHPRPVDDFQDWIDFGADNGISRFAIGEFGSGLHNPGAGPSNVPPGVPDHTERRQWYFDWATRWRNEPKLEACVCFYDQGNSEGWTELRVSSGGGSVFGDDLISMQNLVLLETPTVTSSTKVLLLDDEMA